MIFRARNCVCLLLVASFVVADEQSKPNEKAALLESNAAVKGPQPPPPSTTTTTEVPKPHNTTTVAPTTTPVPEPTTTSTTTTHAPPPSTSTTTTTTTAKPTPSPTPSPTPTPTPTPAPTTPKPAPTNENWVVNGPNGTVCIVANMVIQISVPYKSVENKTVESSFRVDHVANASATGTCGINTENLTLKWNNVSATFNFALNTSTLTYSIDSVNIVIPVDNKTFPNNTMTNVTELNLVYNGSLFSVPLNNSYTCATVAPLSLNGTTMPTTNTTVSGKLTVAHVHVQAFGTKNETGFRAPMDCASTETPDIVPIAVGLVLAGLVVVVLVAYLVGRRRAQSRGYLSM